MRASDRSFDVDAIVFDCDGVLVDSTESIERSWRLWATRLGLDAGAILPSVHGRTSRAIAADWLPPDAVDAAAALMEEVELSDVASVREVPGAGALLAAIPPDRWGIVTSGTRPLFEARLAVTGLPTPAIAVTAEDVSRSKPDPEGYACAVRLLGADPARVLVFEDTVPGMAAARAAGVQWVVRIGKGAALAAEDAVIADLRQASWRGRLELAGDGWRRLDPD
jgi:sugar-phosphatase